MDPLYGQRTTHTKKENIDEKWIVVDADGLILGRLATAIAHRVMGKHLPAYQPGVALGDKVIIINAEKIKVSGNKVVDKMYYWHTGFLGGIKKRNMERQMTLRPEKVIMDAIVGMIPKTRHGRKLATRIRIFKGSEHHMEAQRPEPVSIL